MFGYTILHGGDLNENDNSRNGKLIIHGYIILHGAILTEMNILKRDIIHLIFWDRRSDLLGSKD